MRIRSQILAWAILSSAAGTLRKWIQIPFGTYMYFFRIFSSLVDGGRVTISSIVQGILPDFLRQDSENRKMRYASVYRLADSSTEQ